MAILETKNRRVHSSSRLLRARVKNGEGEDVGTVVDLMVDVSSGRIAFAVISLGGILGLGNKLLAIPWSALALDPHLNIFTVDATREMLRHAPTFERENWANMSDPEFQAGIYSFYGSKPYWD